MTAEQSQFIKLGDRIRTIEGSQANITDVSRLAEGLVGTKGTHERYPVTWWPISCINTCAEAEKRFKLAKLTPVARVRLLPPSVYFAPPAARTRELPPEVPPAVEAGAEVAGATVEPPPAQAPSSTVVLPALTL